VSQSEASDVWRCTHKAFGVCERESLPKRLAHNRCFVAKRNALLTNEHKAVS